MTVMSLRWNSFDLIDDQPRFTVHVLIETSLFKTFHVDAQDRSNWGLRTDCSCSVRSFTTLAVVLTLRARQFCTDMDDSLQIWKCRRLSLVITWEEAIPENVRHNDLTGCVISDRDLTPQNWGNAEAGKISQSC